MANMENDITLKDLFAGMALIGLLGQPLGEGYLTITKEQQVKKAFEYADAMLAEKRNATETSFR